MVGYELVKGLGMNKDEKEKSLDTQKVIKNLKKNMKIL